MDPASTWPALWRRALATLIALGYTAGMFYALCDRLGETPWPLVVPGGLLIGAAGLLHVRRLWAQLFSRSVFWSHLLFVTLIAVFGTSHAERRGGLAFVAAAAAVLLLLGPRGVLDEDRRSPFSPLAFRASLTGLLLLALADAQTLLFYGVATLRDGGGRLALACGVLLCLSLVGLYRLRLWGLLLGIIANAFSIWAALSGRLGVSGPLPWAVAVTAGLQILLPLPLLYAILRQKPRPAGDAAGAWRLAATGAVIALLGLALIGAFVWHPPMPPELAAER